jgi:hypothetical protein
MRREPLYHEVSSRRFGVPAWWFGAPAVAFLYVFVTPRFLPELLPIPPEVPANLAASVRWLIGLVLGVALLSIFQLARWWRIQRRR